MIDADERERDVIQLLESWPRNSPGVLVGGYAVAAYGVPRYSVDVDIVVPAAGSGEWTSWLKTHGLKLKSTYRPGQSVPGRIELQRWHDRHVTLDLMVGGVRDRDSEVIIGDEWLLRAPLSVRLELLSGSLTTPVGVVRLEGLWATKLLAGRPHDLTDLFGIMGQVVRLEEVRELFEGYSGEASWRKFRAVSSRVRNRKTYVDSLSRLLRGSPEDPNNQRQWDRFVKMVKVALPAGGG